MEFFNLLQAAPAGNGLVTIGMLVAMLGVMYLLILRPQRKEQKKQQEMLNTLKKGDKIVTIGGIHGSVSSVEERTIIIKVDENCKIKMSRSAIASVIKDDGSAPAESNSTEK